MNETLPAPPVPPGLCLRHLPYLPLKIKELQNSTLVRKAPGDAFRAAVLLWMAAWWETPAASLPNDETELMAIAGYLRGGETAWAAIRAEAMRGFVLCADGRLYHGTLVTAALEATLKARKKGSQTEAARAALAAKREADRNKVAQPLLQTGKTSVTDKQTVKPTVTDGQTLLQTPEDDCNRPKNDAKQTLLQREEEQEEEFNRTNPSFVNRLPREATVTDTVTAKQSDRLRPSLPANDALLYQLMEAAGVKLGSTPSLFVIGPISSLIDSGEVDLLLDVLPVIREKASRETIPNGSINSWKFYVADIRAHAAKRKAQDSEIGAGKTLSIDEIMGGPKNGQS